MLSKNLMQNAYASLKKSEAGEFIINLVSYHL